ncbi:cytochrome P450 [Lindgomyces ingoldianus]|uniref:Cytochrome P450 n=1 Tax=Lindgomyces ingoldianus TaxID=673940 RepID=A0ACB6QQV3_9PLEO|nr:cytochrome P450 [Lindgomyces ingoldianus]KAF2469379.1 cytochrome P450 [Lindgomyces ingoldianus]
MLQGIFQQLRFVLLNRHLELALGVLTVSVLLQLTHSFCTYLSRPKNVRILSKPYSPLTWFKNFDFILNAPRTILRGYQDRGHAQAFAIPSLGEYTVLACTEDDIKAVCDIDEPVLSFPEAMTDRLKNYWTMYGFQVGDIDPHSSIPMRVIKVLLRMHLPVLRPVIESRIRQGFEKALGKGCRVDGYTSVSTYMLSRTVIDEMNVRIILGDELSEKPGCVDTAIRYTEDVVVTAEICRQLPSILTPVIAPLMMGYRRSMQKLADFITPVVNERIRRQLTMDTSKTYDDCIQWIIESSRTPAQRATKRLVGQTIGILMASSYQMSMTLVYVLYALCHHPEYIPPLRDEITRERHNQSEDPFKKMYLLDSFLLEVARLNPPEALTVQKKVKLPFTLPSGVYIPPGNLIAVPHQARARNPDIFPNPDQFDARRFLPKHEQQCETEAIAKFTDVSYRYLYWGPPKKACPGRWYVSHALKQVIVHMLMNYDFKLENKSDTGVFSWTTIIFPSPTSRILFRRRERSSGN